MAIQRGTWLCIMMCLFIPSRMLYASECDDVFALAEDTHNSADEALNQKDCRRAAELYSEAVKYYEQAISMLDCTDPNIPWASRNNADSCRHKADNCKDPMSEYTTEVKLFEEYNQAKSLFNEGNAFARKQEWDNAIAAFEDAAQVWEGVAARSQSENAKKASEAAKQARDAADLACDYQKKQ